MKFETWHCDHCDKESAIKEGHQFIHILLTSTETCHNVYNLENKVCYTQLWCEKCITDSEMGIRYHNMIKDAKDKEKAKEEAAKAFEHKIGLILRDMIEDEVTEQLSAQ